MKLVAYPLAALLGLLGIMFVVGAQAQIVRVVGLWAGGDGLLISRADYRP